MTSVEENNLLKSFFKEAARINYLVAIPIIGVVLALSIFFTMQDYLIGLGILGVVILSPFIWAAFYFPKLWIYLIALSGIAFFKTSGEGVSIADVGIGAMFLGGLFIWFYHVLFVKRDRIVHNLADWLILFFYIMSAGAVVIAVLNGVEILDAAKEYLLFMTTLLYFPIRYYIKSRKDIAIFLSLSAFMVFVVDLFQFYGYYQVAFKDLTYAYQLGRSVRVNQALFTAGTTFGIVFFFFTKKRQYRFLIAIFAAVTFAALISTFTRTFWVILLGELFLLFFLLSFRKKLELAVLVSALAGFALLLAFVLLKDNTALLLGTITTRFTSAGKGTEDISVQARLNEYNVALSHVREHPLGGNGFFKEYSYFDPITSTNLTYTINHNGFIYLMYRLGIPLAIVYCLFFFIYLFKSIRLTFLVRDDFYRALIISAALSLIMMLISNTTASIWAYRDGMFVIVYSIFAISKAEEHFREKSKQLLIEQKNS